jgi:hypothetical protein
MIADSDAQALFSRHVQTPVCKAIQFVWPIQSHQTTAAVR